VFNIITCQCEHNPIAPGACEDGDCNTLDTYNTQTCLCEHTPVPPPDCNDDDCNTSDFYNIETCECEHEPIAGCPPVAANNKVLAPNAFSPNDDGMNDVFGVSGNEIATIRISIYNRFGQLVFEGNKPTDFWDGTFKAALCEIGVYVYWAEGTFTNGETFTLRGNVTLLR